MAATKTLASKKIVFYHTTGSTSYSDVNLSLDAADLFIGATALGTLHSKPHTKLTVVEESVLANK